MEEIFFLAKDRAKFKCQEMNEEMLKQLMPSRIRSLFCQRKKTLDNEMEKCKFDFVQKEFLALFRFFLLSRRLKKQQQELSLM